MNYLVDLFASLSIFVVPLLIGSFWGGSIAQRFLRGALFIGILAFVALFPLPLPYASRLGMLVCATSIMSLGSVLYQRYKKPLVVVNKNSLYWLFIGILFTLYSAFLFFTLFKSLTPYPYHMNWDVYEHIKLSQELLAGRISVFPSHMSDTFTFNGYTPLFHLLLSLPSALFKASLQGVYYFAEWWFYLTVVLSSIAISFKVFKHKLHALVGGIFAATVFSSAVVYMPLFFLPQSLTALLTVLLLFFAKHETKKDMLILFLSCLILFLLHFVIGFVGAGIVLLWHGYHYLKERVAILHTPWVLFSGGILSGLSLIGMFLLHALGGIQLTGREEAVYYQFGLPQLAQFFLSWYGILGIILLPVGLFVLFRSVKSEHKVLAILSLLIFAVCFSPLSYALKFFSIGFFFMNLILTAGVSRVLFLLPQKAKRIGVGLLALAMTSIFYANQVTYKQFLYHSGVESHVSPLEMDAGKFLQSKKGVFLISDPATQGVLEAVGNADSQGGVYMSEASRKTLSHLSEIDEADTKELLLSVTDELQDKKFTTRYLVLSGRYFAWLRLPQWQRESFYFNIWKPRELSVEDNLVIQKYLDAGLIPVYANSEMVLFEL